MIISAISSLPVRGAWIEMQRLPASFRRASSLPVRGAWIEIGTSAIYRCSRPGRSPCGERGLKWEICNDLHAVLSVAPRAGSVD